LSAKGAVRRSAGRPAQYEAVVKADEVGGRQIDMLLRRVTGGKVVPLVSHLLSGATLSREEIEELKRLITEAERSFTKQEADDE
jgi:BlaI family transcriptional regulator, penicillinase repressor